MRPLQFLSPLLLLAFAAPEAEAQQFGSLFRYNYLEIDYARTEMDGVGPSLHGYGLRASIESTMDVRVLANWRATKGEGNKRDDLEAGFGFYNGINRQVDAIIDFKYLQSRRQTQVESQKKDGWAIEGGIRTFPNDYIEFDLSAEYRSLFKSEFGGHTALLLHGTENIAVSVRYSYFSEQQTLEAGIRFSI